MLENVWLVVYVCGVLTTLMAIYTTLTGSALFVLPDIKLYLISICLFLWATSLNGGISGGLLKK